LGVPLIVPLEGLIDNVLGSPVADQAYGATPPVADTDWL
jgi:hypothetical protein